MLATRRWRDWNSAQRLEKSADQELTKPTKRPREPLSSVLSVHTQPISRTNTLSGTVPPHDPAAWREPFTRWLDFACVRSPRWFTSVAHLHTAYCEWEEMKGGVPCTRDTFERLFRELGFLLPNGLVSGLAFREDFEAHERFQNLASTKTASSRLADSKGAMTPKQNAARRHR